MICTYTRLITFVDANNKLVIKLGPGLVRRIAASSAATSAVDEAVAAAKGTAKDAATDIGARDVAATADVAVNNVRDVNVTEDFCCHGLLVALATFVEEV